VRIERGQPNIMGPGHAGGTQQSLSGEAERGRNLNDIHSSLQVRRASEHACAYAQLCNYAGGVMRSHTFSGMAVLRRRSMRFTGTLRYPPVALKLRSPQLEHML